MAGWNNMMPLKKFRAFRDPADNGPSIGKPFTSTMKFGPERTRDHIEWQVKGLPHTRYMFYTRN